MRKGGEDRCAQAAGRCGSSRRSRAACCHARQAWLPALQRSWWAARAPVLLGAPHSAALLWERTCITVAHGALLNVLINAPAARARPAGHLPLGALPCLPC